MADLRFHGCEDSSRLVTQLVTSCWSKMLQ